MPHIKMMNGNRAVNNLDEFNAQEMATPAAWLTALYAEYDSLFDSLEAVQQSYGQRGASTHLRARSCEGRETTSVKR
ncbi:MAG: hypothetical protein ACXVH4_05370 [Halobacteriota archaeon]